jgi:Flp pilus assembly protein protease CpaA
MVIPSYILGPFYIVLAFILCLVFVVGVKVLIIFIKEQIKAKLSKNKEPIVKEFPEKKKKTNREKSVYLNTEDIDRIYFKKSS